MVESMMEIHTAFFCLLCCNSQKSDGVSAAMQDNLAMAAIRFLNTVAAGVHHTLFRSEGVLREVRCLQVVQPCKWFVLIRMAVVGMFP